MQVILGHDVTATFRAYDTEHRQRGQVTIPESLKQPDPSQPPNGMPLSGGLSGAQLGGHLDQGSSGPERGATTGRGPRRVGVATVNIVFTAEGIAHIEYVGTFTGIPRSGAWLHWSGVELQGVECQVSTGDRPVLRIAKRHVTLIVLAPDPAADVLVRIRYALRPVCLGSKDKGLFLVKARNLPALNPSRAESALAPRLGLLARAPDVVVRVSSEVPDLEFLGPEYIRQPERSSAAEYVFSFYEGLTPFTLVAGWLVADRSSDVTVLTPVGQDGTPPAPLLGEIRRCAPMVMRYLADLSGEAAVKHRGVVALSVPGVSSSCVGSAILLNTTDLALIKNVQARKASLVDVLAHEYAHAWWSFSVLWENRRTHQLVNEMLAIILARDCVATLGVGAATDPHSELWEYAAYAVRQHEDCLLKEVSTPSGAYAACLLVDLTRHHRTMVLAALRQLWNDGRATPLTRRRLHEVLAAHLGELVAD